MMEFMTSNWEWKDDMIWNMLLKPLVDKLKGK